MKNITANQLAFKKSLSNIEQMTLKNIMFNFIGRPDNGVDDVLPLEYTQTVFAKMESPLDSNFLIDNNATFRFVTLTQENQIVIGFLDYNFELNFRILSLEERL
ncbi:hypothetical protein ACFFHH_12720 [Cytobacillus solani]|uniref:hypothetical protein n=1 Tax=Cytobacillus solani TaxID=1637975 RepID=UPI0006AB802D|nr:hypothetical protein [Cytobacillus solani]KOP82248.1 hypothetical protein AMS60_06910 [Bacillus sp. FJAT-21945]USK57149.1 hypothetical protein LIS82_12065 [Cytobacillus solani]